MISGMMVRGGGYDVILGKEIIISDSMKKNGGPVRVLEIENGVVSSNQNVPIGKERHVPGFSFVGLAPGIPGLMNVVIVRGVQGRVVSRNTVPKLLSGWAVQEEVLDILFIKSTKMTSKRAMKGSFHQIGTSRDLIK